MNTKELILIGLDGAMPSMIKKFRDEGCIPNLARLMEEGTFTEALPCPPVDTPTNWVTIATGARTATHGITSFTLHLPGDPLDMGHSTVDLNATDLCQAEFLWDVAERAGKKCLVLNYISTWPSTMDKGILIGGPSPRGHPSWILGDSVHFVCGVSEVAPRTVRFEIGLQRAQGWKEFPQGFDRFLETRIPLNIEVPRSIDPWQGWQRALRGAQAESEPLIYQYANYLADVTKYLKDREGGMR